MISIEITEKVQRNIFIWFAVQISSMVFIEREHWNNVLESYLNSPFACKFWS